MAVLFRNGWALGLVASVVAGCGGDDSGAGGETDGGATSSADGGEGNDGATTRGDAGPTSTHASGELDVTFGEGGRVQLSYGRNFEVRAMAIRPDGRIVLAGADTPPASAWKQALVMQLAADGTLDAGFGTKGVAMFEMGASTDGYVYGATVAPDGNVLLGGSKTAHTTAGALTDFFYMRLLPNGGPDPAFGTQGRTGFDPNGSHKNELHETVFFVGGTAAYVGVSSGSDLYQYPSVSRVTPLGQRQASYGVKGTVHTQIDKRYLHHVAFEKDGKLLFCYGDLQNAAKVYVERYDDTGSLASSGSFAIVDTGGDHSRCRAILAQESGKILVAGAGFTCNTEPSCPGKNVLVRFNEDLTVDDSFDVAGASATLTTDGDEVGLGEQLGGGGARPVAQYVLGERLRTRRFEPGGAIDAAFNQGAGFQDLTLVPGASYRRSGFAVQADGRLTTWADVETDTASVVVLERFWL